MAAVVVVVLAQIAQFIFKRKHKIFIGACLNALQKQGSSSKGKESLSLRVVEGLENSTVSSDQCSCRSVRNQQLDCCSQFLLPNIGKRFWLAYGTSSSTIIVNKVHEIKCYAASKGRKNTCLIYASVSID